MVIMIMEVRFALNVRLMVKPVHQIHLVILNCSQEYYSTDNVCVIMDFMMEHQYANVIYFLFNRM